MDLGEEGAGFGVGRVEGQDAEGYFAGGFEGPAAGVEGGQAEEDGYVVAVALEVELEVADDHGEGAHLAGDLEQAQEGQEVVAVEFEAAEVEVEGLSEVAGVLVDEEQFAALRAM